MKVLLLGVGMQGKAALHDLAMSSGVSQITAADQDGEALAAHVRARGYGAKVKCQAVNASDPAELDRLLAKGFDVAIDLLPSHFSPRVAEAAVRHGAHLVNSVYLLEGMKEVGLEAQSKNLALLPEFGMDPGIDLVLVAEAIRPFDCVEEVRSYGAGIPEPAAAGNALQYKVTWTLEGVLRAYMRPARLLRGGEIIDVPAGHIFDPEYIHEIDIPGLGKLEAYPNGDALHYAEKLGLDRERLSTAGRYSFRYPGHCAFWRIMTALHLLEDEEVSVDGKPVNKRRFLARALEPLLKLGEAERDLAIIRIEVRGQSQGRRWSRVLEVIDRRDLETGLTSMNRTVGFTASIGAQMIMDGRITRRGLLSPLFDVPYAEFVRELQRRGIRVTDSSDA